MKNDLINENHNYKVSPPLILNANNTSDGCIKYAKLTLLSIVRGKNSVWAICSMRSGHKKDRNSYKLLVYF